MRKLSLIAIFLILIPSLGIRAQEHINLFIGTLSSAAKGGLFSCTFDTQSGKLDNLRRAAAINEPSFLTIADSRLYTFARAGNKTNLYSYTIEGFELTPIDSTTVETAAFCYITTDAKNEHLLCASYADGLIGNYGIDPNGRFTSQGNVVKHKAENPTTQQPRAHTICRAPKAGLFYATDLGLDKIIIYTYTQNDQLTPLTDITTEPGAGPRHLDFHPNGKFMAVINELNRNVDIYGMTQNGIYSRHIQTISTLPDSYPTQGTSGADIHYSPDGRFLYASTRGYNSIMVMSVDEKTGLVKLIEHVTEKINWPRTFSIDPTGKFLLVANQNGNSIVVYSIDKLKGTLTLTNHSIAVTTPVCIAFAD